MADENTARPRDDRGAPQDGSPPMAVYDDSGWGVASVDGGRVRFRTEPCGPEAGGEDAMPCPWRVDAPLGQFPPSVFRHSARTAHDLSERRFGCHNSSDLDRPLTCAGFLMRGAQHNLSVRVLGPDEALIEDGGHQLYPSYRAMAIANDVAADDPALADCRDWQDPAQAHTPAPAIAQERT